MLIQMWMEYLEQNQLVLASTDRLRLLLKDLNDKFPYLSKIDKMSIINFLPQSTGDLYLLMKSSQSLDHVSSSEREA